jgi:hypothetical protein
MSRQREFRVRVGTDGAGRIMCELTARGNELGTDDCLRCNPSWLTVDVCVYTFSERDWLAVNRLQWLPFRSALTETAIENPYYIFIALRIRRKRQRLHPNPPIASAPA